MKGRTRWDRAGERRGENHLSTREPLFSRGCDGALKYVPDKVYAGYGLLVQICGVSLVSGVMARDCWKRGWQSHIFHVPKLAKTDLSHSIVLFREAFDWEYLNVWEIVCETIWKIYNLNSFLPQLPLLFHLSILKLRSILSFSP